MNSARDTLKRVGCPIRRSRDQRSLASPPGFSQRATSFIASQCQGIHQMPFFYSIHENRRVQGQNPSRTATSREDTSSGHANASSQLAACPPRSHYNSLHNVNNTPSRLVPEWTAPSRLRTIKGLSGTRRRDARTAAVWRIGIDIAIAISGVPLLACHCWRAISGVIATSVSRHPERR